ncbi:hypothetical protein BKA64DRAFT_704949 [Cadophora sp. MPI-SDFR-AT-0126]|nr:hypothetical protein BKA64DRAFT_704949 [Leotiomycetes sp. MPI-SDFR-AT-0126]
MPPTTRSYVPPSKKIKVILSTKSRPRFMRKLPLELREMVYKYLLVPRTIEVEIMTKTEAEAYAKTIQNAKYNTANLANNNVTTVQSKYVILDDDPSDEDYKTPKKTSPKLDRFRFVTTSDNKLVLHAINRETRHFALKHYTPIFKTASSPGLLFNFELDYLSFTRQKNSSANEMRYRFVDRKGFQQDIARIKNLVYLFSCHHKELVKVNRGTPNTRTFVTRFPALKNVIITLPLEHFDHCKFCNGGEITGHDDDDDLQSIIDGYIDDAKTHFEELKQKLDDAGTEWVAPELVYKTFCLRQRWQLILEDKELKKS